MRPIFIACQIDICSLAGCNNNGAPTVIAGSPPAIISPLVGNWTGKSEVKGGDLAKALNGLAGGPLTGPSTLTLKADGTGYLKVADKAERPITWKQDGDKVVIEVKSAEREASSEPVTTWIATTSSDRRFMTIDLDDVKVKLSKNP
jgi:hypothetical protein